MTSHEAVAFQNLAAGNTPSFALTLGGWYAFAVVATGLDATHHVRIQVLGPDNITWLDLFFPFNNAAAEVDLAINSFSANGVKTIVLSPGTYRFVVDAGVSAAYVVVARALIE